MKKQFTVKLTMKRDCHQDPDSFSAMERRRKLPLAAERIVAQEIKDYNEKGPYEYYFQQTLFSKENGQWTRFLYLKGDKRKAADAFVATCNCCKELTSELDDWRDVKWNHLRGEKELLQFVRKLRSVAEKCGVHIEIEMRYFEDEELQTKIESILAA